VLLCVILPAYYSCTPNILQALRLYDAACYVCLHIMPGASEQTRVLNWSVATVHQSVSLHHYRDDQELLQFRNVLIGSPFLCDFLKPRNSPPPLNLLVIRFMSRLEDIRRNLVPRLPSHYSEGCEKVHDSMSGREEPTPGRGPTQNPIEWVSGPLALAA
jgi:hypothetical protein